MEYRREIDGLRALAVLPVIFFHAGFAPFSGGFVGVDVFFVISGYLITSIILLEKDAGRFSLLRFYERRARRILPALFFVMLVCIPFAWAWMLPHQLKDFAQSLVATAVFLSNVFFYLETDYFNDFAETAPLLHTWTLAVEEQYYLLFPLLLLILWRFGRKATVATLAVAAVVSFAVADWASFAHPAAAFYLLPTRGWELLIGVLIAFYFRPVAGTPRKEFGPLASQVGSLSGLALILYAVIAFGGDTPFPGRYALVPTLGAALIILFARPDTWVGRVLASTPFVGVGLISYSAYLWHQPLLAFARLHTLDGLPLGLALVLCAAVLPLSYISWRWVEKPARTVRLNLPVLASAVSVVAVCFVAVGYMGHRTDGFMSYKLDQLDPRYRKYVIDRNSELALRKASWDRYVAQADTAFPAGDGRARVLILGDSKSEDLYLALMMNEELFSSSVFRRMRLDDECMRDLVDRLDRPNAGIGDPICRTEVEELLGKPLLEQANEIVLTATWQIHTYRHAADVVGRLSSQGKKVSVISTANFNDVTSLSMAIAKQKMSRQEAAKYVYHNIRGDWRKHSLALKQDLTSRGQGRFLEKLDLLCDQGRHVCNLFGSDGKPYIYDSGHLTVQGAEIFGRKVYDAGWFH